MIAASIEEAKPEPPKKPGPMFGCIAGPKGRTRCGRELEFREFVFQDDNCAADRYDSRFRKIPFTQLSVCHACADRVRELRKLDTDAHNAR